MAGYDQLPWTPKDNGPRFTWDCDHPGCRKYIACYTQHGLNILREEHISTHRREQKSDTESKQILDRIRDKNINKLDLTLTDIGFLKTRGIKIDEDINLDFSIAEQPSKSEGLSQKEWAEILERAFQRSSVYGIKDKT